jgi:hypothetical protein
MCFTERQIILKRMSNKAISDLYSAGSPQSTW